MMHDAPDPGAGECHVRRRELVRDVTNVQTAVDGYTELLSLPDESPEEMVADRAELERAQTRLGELRSRARP
jgi:hypothetical protein